MSQGLDIYFSKEGVESRKRYRVSLVIGDMQINTRFTRIHESKKQIIKVFVRTWRKRNSHTLLVGL